jgi:3-oxoadipate enol-lactonase/4-carboxymuconolactone decarboxylase
VSAVDLYHRIEGAEGAPPLLLSGSLGSTLGMWDAVIPALTRHFRVIRVDHRGHGGSPVPRGPYEMGDLGGDIMALLDRLGIKRASFAGNSLGGMVGLWLAVHAPDRIDRLALVATSARLGPPEFWRDRAALARDRGTAALAEAAVARWLTPAFAAKETALVADLVRMIGATPAEGYAGCCEAIASWDITARLGEISAPTLVVVGRDDPATPAPHAYAIAAQVPGAHVAVVDRSAHVPIFERPLVLARLLVDHLGGGDLAATTELADTVAERAPLGEAVRRAVLGDAHVDRAMTNTTAFTAPFQDLVTRYPWGEIWTRPGLSRQERSIVTLTVLAVGQHDDELAMHVVAAIRNGLTPEQIQEILLQVAVYAGVPIANRAFSIAERALVQAGILSR